MPEERLGTALVSIGERTATDCIGQTKTGKAMSIDIKAKNYLAN